MRYKLAGAGAGRKTTIVWNLNLGAGVLATFPPQLPSPTRMGGTKGMDLYGCVCP